MIIRREDLQTVCSNISVAIDNSDASTITDSLSLKTVGNNLCASVTNREYFAQALIDIHENVDFNATVSADTFTKLVSKITNDTVELTVNDKNLTVKADGTYKIPLIFNVDEMLELPEIEINNVQNSFDIDASVLSSILQYNAKELTKGVASRPIQKMYYVDNEGAITFTTGACVNSFTLPESIRVLFNPRLVKLFKLFSDGVVHITYGVDDVVDGITQSKIRLENNTFSVTSILSCDDTLIDSVPVSSIRGRATRSYDYTVDIDTERLTKCFDRLMIFSKSRPYCTMTFTNDCVEVANIDGEGSETVYYTSSTPNTNYKMSVNIVDFKATVDSCQEKVVTLHFGDGSAVVLEHGAIRNVIPEAK